MRFLESVTTGREGTTRPRASNYPLLVYGALPLMNMFRLASARTPVDISYVIPVGGRTKELTTRDRTD